MLPLLLAILVSRPQTARDWIVFEPIKPIGKHVVLIAGDEEYRSEEALPYLARILTFRHGFRCTVLFSINDKGEIDPDRQDNQPGLEALRTADLCVIALRFRRWPDSQMRHFDNYVQSRRPILALRTSTHAFDHRSGPFEKYGWQSKTWPGGFGKRVLGETWLSHWGEHGKQATRGVSVSDHPILNGVINVFGTTDVYEAHPPHDARVLLRGEVVGGLDPKDPPAGGRKKTAHGVEQDLNDPMMPIAWIRESDKRRVMVCTMGASEEFRNEGLRRLMVNGAYWSLGLSVPDKAEVDVEGRYDPSPFGFGRFKKGVRPADLRSGAN